MDVLPFSNPPAFVLLVLATALTPGPTNLLLFVSGLPAGARHAIRLVLVAGTTLTGIFLLSGATRGLVLGFSDCGAPILRIAAACYLCYLA